MREKTERTSKPEPSAQPAPWTVRRLLTSTADFFTRKGIVKPRVEAEWLLAEVLGTDRLGLYLDHDRVPSADERARLREMVRRRGAREPLQHILGRAPFHRIELAIGPGAFCPRPETEILVDRALERLEEVQSPKVRDSGAEHGAKRIVVDLGTGSGAIACALAAACPDAFVYAVDLSPEALRWAARNVEQLALTDRVRLYEGDLTAPLAGILDPAGCDLVVANPPYVPVTERGRLPPEVEWFDPPLAVFSTGPAGTEIYPRLIAEAVKLLKAGGWLLVEVGAGQAQTVARLMGTCPESSPECSASTAETSHPARSTPEAPLFDQVRITRDLNDVERVVEGRKPRPTDSVQQSAP